MLKVVAIGHQRGLVKEADAAEAITPGHFVIRNSTGKFIKNTVADNGAELIVATENDIFGKGIDDAYTTNERVMGYLPVRGDEIQALVAAAAPAIVLNDYIGLVSGGTVAKVATRALAIGKAQQAVDNSAGASAVRLRVEMF